MEAMHSEKTGLSRHSDSPAEDSFQQLLLRLSSAAAAGSDSHALIRLFCQATREFFRVSGSYFWELLSADEMVGREASGFLEDRFPGTRAVDERDALVAVNRVASLRTTRITMTLPLINAARRVLFVVAGADKAAAVRLALESTAGAATAPAARVQLREGRVDWILDAAAASLVQCPATEVMA